MGHAFAEVLYIRRFLNFLNFRSMKKILIFSLIAVIGLSCKKTFLDETPKDVLAPENLYINKSGFERGLFGLYNQVRQERGGYLQDGTTADPSNDITNGIMMVGVDNAYSNYPAANNEKYYNQWSSGGPISMVTDNYNATVFSWLYKIINGANTIINRAETTSGIDWTTSEKNQIVAEAKVVRVWAYRHLTFLWGAVPLKLDESSGSAIRTDYERTPVATIRAFMEQELLWAEANMADQAVDEGRFGKAVATHYLTELYLTEGNYQAAKDKAMTIINNPMYKLITQRYGVNKANAGSPFTDMFLDGNSNRSQGNTEAIWVMQNAYQSLGGDANIMRRYWVNRYDAILIGGKNPITVSVANGGRGLGRFGATRYAFQTFASTIDGRKGSTSADQRGGSTGGGYAWRFSWTYGTPVTKLNLNYNQDETLNNAQWPNIRKWDWAPANNPSDVASSSGYNSQIYLRLGETYLFLAEAQFYLGDLNGAAQTINVLRTRANSDTCKASDISIDFILDERSRELFSEEHRRYTLLRVRDPQNSSLPIWISRTNKYNKTIANNTPVIATDTLLPIPQVVINANLTKVMPQNPGY